MDCLATQIYEEEDFECTQRISQQFEEQESIQVGILNIDSIEYQIKRGTTTIGRLNTCDICIKDLSVSQIHAEIEADRGQGSTWICDLQSSNKTKLNNAILRPKRLYELKDGSVINFGKVRAVYRTYCPKDDIVIPETPAPTQQKIAKTIIPNTPDSSINNSSTADTDGSVILGTQTEKEKSVFRRPLLQQAASTSIQRKNDSRGTSMSENDDSQIDIRLRVSVNNGSESEEISIFDMETQNNEEGCKTVASTSIHDVETQIICTNMCKYHEENVTANEQLSKVTVRGKVAESAKISINDMETQVYTNLDVRDKHQSGGKNMIDVLRTIAKKSTINIHDVETQNYIIKTVKNIRDTPAKKCTMNIHDLETQNYIVDSAKNVRDTFAKKTTMNIHDLETQNYIVDDAKSNTGTRKLENDKYETASVNQAERNIHDSETQKLDNERTVQDVGDTQLELDGITNKSSNDQLDKNNDDEINDTADVAKSETGCKNTTKLPTSRSSSPGSLNLSSPGIDEDDQSSPLNQSAHLLESSDLLEYFGDGIDKPGEIQKYNASTPKPHSKTSSQPNNAANAANASDNENDEEGNIHDLPTQIVNCKSKALLSDDSENEEKKSAPVKRKAPKKGCERSRPQKIDDDSETDAEDYLEELARKQGASVEAPSKSRDENVESRNDRGTSVESDDMFDMPTQQTKNYSAKNMSDSLIEQPKTNQANTVVVDDMASMQKTNDGDKHDRDDVLSADINDMVPNQLILSRKASSRLVIGFNKNFSRENDQNDVDDTAPTQIIRENIDVSKSGNHCTSSNLDSEDINYEMAPTQVISEIVEKRNSKTPYGAETAKSSKVDLNDTLERNLNEMFDDVNDDSVHTAPLMSTQYLEDILQSSQCDGLFPDKSTVDDKASTDNAPQPRKKNNRLSRNKTIISEVSKNNANDSQNSDIYFANIITKRKRNVIRDTQELVNPTEDVISSCQDSNSPQKKLKKAAENDKMTAKSKKKGKKIAKSRNKIDTDDLVDNTVSKTSETNRKIARKTRSAKRINGTAPKTSEQIPEGDLCTGEVDHAEANLERGADTCTPCSTSGQGEQLSSTGYENYDDILSRLPAVRILGTLSNPPSPSTSSTSTVHSDAIAINTQAVAKDMAKTGSKIKLLRKQDITNGNCTVNTPPLLLHDKVSSSVDLEVQKINELLETMNESEDSDIATSYRRFKQMADRTLGNKLANLEKQKKADTQDSKLAVFDKNKDTRSLSDKSKNSKQSFNLEGSKNPTQTSSRTTRYSNRQNNESVQLPKEACVKDTIDKSAKSATKSTAANKKRGVKMIEDSTEQTNSKKHKADQVIDERPVFRRSKRTTAKTTTDRQSSHIHEDIMEDNSRENPAVIENTESPGNDKTVIKNALKETQSSRKIKNSKTHESIDVMEPSVTRTRCNDGQAEICVSDKTTDKNGDTEKQRGERKAKEKEIVVSQTRKKTPKIVLKPIVVDEESQEVEMFMMRKVPNDVQDKHSSIRGSSNVGTLQRESRSTRSRKRANTNAPTDSSSIESSVSSDTSDLESVQSDSVASTRAKRGKIANNPAPVTQKPQAPEKNKVFKKPTRVTRYSAVYSTNDDNQNNLENGVCLKVRSSRSKAAVAEKTENVEMHESKRRSRRSSANAVSEINTSVNLTFRVSTPTRARRSTSSMNISSPTAARYRILFTGITEDKYNKVVKTLGGNNVDDPELCTVLVTDKVRRTYKFLCALAKGVPIVSIDWLNDSETAAQFLDWENYILKDPAAEARFGFRLRKSLDKAKEKGLLVGYTIVLTPNVAPPPTEELKDIIMSCGGRALLRPPAAWPERALIMSRKEDLPNAKKYLAKAPKTVTVQSTEFILTGILRQEVDFDKYRLI